MNKSQKMCPSEECVDKNKRDVVKRCDSKCATDSFQEPKTKDYSVSRTIVNNVDFILFCFLFSKKQGSL